jgi:hypothetical protein
MEPQKPTLKKGKKIDIELKPFDSLELIRRTEDGSSYKGAGGSYYFKPTGKQGLKEPIFFLYLNHKYMTGIFRTKKELIFNGDLRTESGGKTYLSFRFSDSKIEIYTKGQGTGFLNPLG